MIWEFSLCIITVAMNVVFLNLLPAVQGQSVEYHSLDGGKCDVHVDKIIVVSCFSFCAYVKVAIAG